MRNRPAGWSDNTWLAWCALLRLSPNELTMLQQRIQEIFGPDEPEGGAGVREPRRPGPLDPLLAQIAKELPTEDVGSYLE